jgi:RNA polymerase sigma-70 factor (ECF subfamily)
MIEQDETPHLAAERSGASDEFQRLTDPYQRELLVHCYRMLGSQEDAEDALQETFVRAWRGMETLKDPAALRAWLYRIATNVSLDMIAHRKARWTPTLLNASADPHDPLPASIAEPIWIEPLPEMLLDGQSLNPEARYEIHESVTLAFLAALQQLPGRQRAVLLLRDVLGWRASEVAELLEISVVAVNSALQRARATIKKHQPDRTFYSATHINDTQIASLLARYVQAWEMADSANLVTLLREDAVLTMPPVPAWFRGRAAIQYFLDSFLFAGSAQGRFRLTPTRANGCPAFGVYQLDDNGLYRPAALHVLTIALDQIAQIDDFLTFDQRLFSRFGLPLAG